MSNDQTLDRIDFRILGELQSNARISLSQLADRVGLSVSPCSVRLKKLEKQGYIAKYTAEINTGNFPDFATVFAEATLIDQREKTYRAFENLVADVPEILECHSIGGETDYLLKICVATMTAYQTIVERLLQESDLVDQFTSKVLFAVVKNTRQLPITFFEDRCKDDR